MALEYKYAKCPCCDQICGIACVSDNKDLVKKFLNSLSKYESERHGKEIKLEFLRVKLERGKKSGVMF